MHGDFSNSDLPSNLAEQGQKQQSLMFWESLGQLDFVPDVGVFDRCSLSLGGTLSAQMVKFHSLSCIFIQDMYVILFLVDSSMISYAFFRYPSSCFTLLLLSVFISFNPS